MSINKAFVLFLAMVLASTLAACGGGVKEMTAEQIRDAANKAVNNLKTVRMDMDMQANGTMDMRIEGTDYHITLFMMGNTTTEIDIENEKSHILSQTHSKFEYPPELQDLGNESPISDMTVETYLIDNVMYTKSYTAETTTTWTKQKMTEESWETFNQMAQQMNVLQSAPVELLGSERLDGIDCYVLKVTPDMVKMYQTMMQNLSEAGKWVSKIFDFEEMIQNTSMTMLVAKDTFFVIKDEMKMTLVMNQESMHLPLGNDSMEMRMDYEIVSRGYDQNEPVTITAPTEVPITG
jgi:hypothetical protein